MDPLCATIMIEYEENSVVHSHYQCGVFVTPFLITPANWIFIEDHNRTNNVTIQKITVEVGNKNGSTFKKAIDWTIIHSEGVEEAVKSSFRLMDYRGEEHNMLSYFVILKVNTTIISHTQYCNVERGQDVLVFFPQLVERHPITGKSAGIISRVLGNNNELFLTDALTSYTGSPVCSDLRDSFEGGYRMLSGMIICPIPCFSDRPSSRTSVFYLGVSIHAILQSLDLHYCSRQDFNLQLTLASPYPHSQMNTDFAVIIENGPDMGTGIIVHEDGFILTNAHVVKYSSEVTVRFQNEMYTARVLFSSTPTSHLDIAVLYISGRSKFPSCKLSERCHFRGEVAYFVGHGVLLGSYASFISKGSIIDYTRHSILTSCLVLKGSSGGAILNNHGEVISLLTGMQSVPFPQMKTVILSRGIPVYLFKDIIEQFLETKDINRLQMLLAYEREMDKL